jgi:FAD/FMN-containing dehydrogenase
LIDDCVVSASSSQAANLWRLREEMPEAQHFEGGSIKHDVAVPVSHFIRAAIAAVEKEMPGIRPVPFGHLCDGNIHFNLSQPEGATEPDFLSRWADFDRIVRDIALRFDGTFAAEHGIGLLKLEDMRHYKSAIELDLMRRLKLALDPNDLMNPGKVLPASTP